MRAGTQDAIRLLRESLASIADERRTVTVTRKQLGDAADALDACLETEPVSVAAWAALFADAIDHVRTVADMAQAFAQERGDASSAELRVWAAAARACIESHVRDAGTFLPWLRLKSPHALAMARRPVELAPEWAAIQPFFPVAPALADAPEHFQFAIRELAGLRAQLAGDPSADPETLARVDSLTRALNNSATEAAALIRRFAAIAETAESMSEAMDFTFLFDNSRKLFSIGFRVAEGELDENCYDLLASEARLASFVAIAKGDVPVAHWFRLGRALTPVGRGSALISWSGSMFEYLMPALVMRLRKQSAEPDVRAGRNAADRIRRRTRRALGNLGIGL